MTIGSLQSNHLAHPRAARVSVQSGTNAPWSAAPGPAPDPTGPARGSFGPAVPNGPWSSQVGSGTSSASASPAHPPRNLASDIQAMLIQTQTIAAPGSGTTAAGSAAGGGATAVSPEQKLASDLLTLLSDPRSATTPNAQTANANPTEPAGRTEHHHHHHHRDGGFEASGATDVAGASRSSGTTASSAASGEQGVFQVFAANIAHALQAYAGAGPSTTMPALTV